MNSSHRYGIAALVLLAACGRAGAREVEQRGAPRARTPQRTSPVAVNDSPPRTLSERLAREASARPERTIAVEDYAAMLSSRGVRIASTKQVLASPVGAAYCTQLKTASGASAALCEFASDEDARRGEQTSRRLFDQLMPRRTLAVRHNALLTVGNADRGAEEQLLRAFADLAPRVIARR